jgi:uncharacterized membrane protein YkgB
MGTSTTWTEKELEKVAEERGNEHWIRDVYFRWHIIGVIENIIFIAALIALWIIMR